MARFDHVALALDDPAPFWDLFAGSLGGRWVGGGDSLGGFSFGQLRFSDGRYVGGSKVEVLEPLAGGSDFLSRFLAAHGPGPHHLTFTVPDLGATLDKATALGYQPLGVSLEDPSWKEAFLHPREAAGIVVQLAFAAGEPDGPPPPGLPASGPGKPAELVHVAHAVADLEAGLSLFKGLLDGETVDAGAGAGLGYVDLAWPGSGADTGRLRLLAGDPVAPWVGGRSGRLHSLCFRLDDPGRVAGSVERPGWWEVIPAPPLGVRLVLIERDAPVPTAT